MSLLHTMLRVGDLQESIDFYTDVIGMNLVRQTERPDQGYSLAFVAFGGGKTPAFRTNSGAQWSGRVFSR